jgi:transposase
LIEKTFNFKDVPKKDISIANRGLIVGAKAYGSSSEKLATQFCVCKRTINRIRQRYREEGTLKQRDGRGRKRKTTEQDDRRIAAAVKCNRFITRAQILRDIPLDVSERTVSTRIREPLGYSSYRAVRKPFLRPYNISKRLNWCLAHRNWTVEKWRKVIWTDESPFHLRYMWTKRVWISSQEKYSPECLQGTVKHDKKVMVWGCMTAYGVWALHRIVGIMKKKMYQNILETEFQR